MNGKTDIRQKWLVIVASLAVGLLILDRLVLNPLAAHWKEQGTRITQLRQSVDQGTALLERQEAIRQRWKRMTSEVLSNDASSAENTVLKAASRWARESRIIFTSVMPQWQKYEEGYQTLECRATAYGDLTAITRFLYEMERDPLAVRLRSVELTAKDEQGRQLNLDARFSALSLPNPQSPAP